MSTYVRTALTALLLSAVAFEFAVSQTVAGLTLKELTRYYGAAATLVAKAVSGVSKVEPLEIPKGNRKEVRDELEKISLKISMLRADQQPLVFDLSEYVDKVRAGSLAGNSRKNEWYRILLSIDSVSQVVQATLNVVETSRWLKVTLDAQDRLALREVLLGRASLMSQLRLLPAPGTTDEIDQLDQMNKFYRQLVKSLGELNTALTRASERLTVE